MNFHDIINKQTNIFDKLKSQNNSLLGFTIIFIGFIIPNLQRDYIVSYLGIIFSFSISLFGFYFSTIPLSENKKENIKKISIITKILRISIGILFLSILTFSSIIIGGLK
jgi:hypothetical protein